MQHASHQSLACDDLDKLVRADIEIADKIVAYLSKAQSDESAVLRELGAAKNDVLVLAEHALRSRAYRVAACVCYLVKETARGTQAPPRTICAKCERVLSTENDEAHFQTGNVYTSMR